MALAGWFDPMSDPVGTVTGSEPALDLLEHQFYGRPVELIERWWNGLFGRLARADAWLHHDGEAWYVTARLGDGDSTRHRWRTVDEHIAREWLDTLIATSGTPRERWVRLDHHAPHPDEQAG